MYIFLIIWDYQQLTYIQLAWNLKKKKKKKEKKYGTTSEI